MCCRITIIISYIITPSVFKDLHVHYLVILPVALYGRQANRRTETELKWNRRICKLGQLRKQGPYSCYLGQITTAVAILSCWEGKVSPTPSWQPGNGDPCSDCGWQNFCPQPGSVSWILYLHSVVPEGGPLGHGIKIYFSQWS